jgi:hypothetical protein
VHQLESQLEEGCVELQSNKTQLSTAQEASVTLTEERDRLSLDLYRPEGMHDYLEEHQGNYVLELEVQVEDGCAELQSNKTQLSTTQKQLNISQYNLDSAGRMQGRLNDLFLPVMSELVRLMALEPVSLEDFSSDSLKKIKWVTATEAGELLRAFFTHRDFDSRKTLKKLVCLVLFVVHVRC